MTALSVQNLSFAYGAHPVLKDVSFALEKGQFCGLLGPNGAGKSTLYGLMTGLLPIQTGKIEIAGADVSTEPRRALSKIGVVFQQPTLELDMSVEQNMRYFAALHGLAGKEIEARIVEALELVNMAERRKEKVRSLNGGHRRRMEIARSLIHRPEVLLLDEATVGLDVEARQSIVDDVHALTDVGISILWATHLVDEIRQEDQLVILVNGEIKANGVARDVAGDGSILDRFLELTQVESAR